MAAITQLSPSALPGGGYGSFGGKQQTNNPAGPHDPGLITQLRPFAAPGGRYGDFGGKTATAAPPPPPPPASQGPQPQGRAEWLGFESKPRSREERTLHLRKDRERFGIVEEAAKVIARVAARQARALEEDNQKRFEELERELAASGIPWKGGYLELLNEARRRIIDAEIKEHLQALQFIEEEIMLLLLVSVL